MKRAEFKKIRIEKRYTQAQLARVLGLTPVTISRIENGHSEITKMMALAMRSLPNNGGAT